MPEHKGFHPTAYRRGVGKVTSSPHIFPFPPAVGGSAADSGRKREFLEGRKALQTTCLRKSEKEIRMPKATIGVIGGSGLYAMEGLEQVERLELSTPFGTPSDADALG